MDISVLASVGSFVVSERVLKPKASILVILGCVLAYDLTTKTHDVSSLRVYRGTYSTMLLEWASAHTIHVLLLLPGPGLLAFSLVMVAWSLRTWRRNGVACDELLFLPGTPHGEELNSPTTTTTAAASPTRRSEGDVAAGVGLYPPPAAAATATSRTTRTFSHDSSVSSIHEFLSSWDEDSLEDDEMADTTVLPGNNGELELMERSLLSNRTATIQASNQNELTIPVGTPPRDPLARISPASTPTAMNELSERSAVATSSTSSSPQPNIIRIGNLFFFRSATSSTQSAAYAPSGPSVVGAAIDLCMPVLFNFHLFIEAYGRGPESDVPAKILPLIFLSVLIVRTVFPFGRRGRFWSTLAQTATAPVPRSRPRDAYIGDVFTSLIRPLQDVVFALAYYVTVIWGTVLTSRMTLTEAGELLQRSWLLHNVVLPSCALLPLWWKFLQTLRECYDTGQRWPHLGNAFKYLSAALVILYGMTHPEDRRSPWWILAFVAALIYQIAWDTLVDWELFVIEPREYYGDGMDVSDPSWYNRSMSPHAHTLLAIHRFLTPLRATVSRIPSLLRRIQLRPQRLYKSDKFYWRIFYYNAVFRFCWMLCFIPAYHLSSTGRSVVTTFSSDTKSYVGVLLPIAEIVRRTVWGFLYLEMKTIRMSEGDPSVYTYSRVEVQEESENSNGSSGSTKPHYFHLPSWLVSQQQMHHDAATNATSTGAPPLASIQTLWNLLPQYNETTRNQLFVAELSLWGLAFLGLGVWATT